MSGKYMYICINSIYIHIPYRDKDIKAICRYTVFKSHSQCRKTIFSENDQHIQAAESAYAPSWNDGSRPNYFDRWAGNGRATLSVK